MAEYRSDDTCGAANAGYCKDGGPNQVDWTTVVSVSDGGRCVGRAEGYGPSEECAIVVGGTGGGVLGSCAVFDLYGGDIVTLPGGEQLDGSDCPVGAGLAAGNALSWTSNRADQGSVGNPYGWDNGCAAKGACGLPFSQFRLGGGWQLCFA
eukprot:COSAG04_NODE_5915_length_1457_cov_1.702504_2_plen_151_part_00